MQIQGLVSIHCHLQSLGGAYFMEEDLNCSVFSSLFNNSHRLCSTGIQLLELILCLVWIAGTAGPIIFVFKKYLGFRVILRREVLGLDATEHNRAYGELELAMDILESIDAARQRELEELIKEQDQEKMFFDFSFLRRKKQVVPSRTLSTSNSNKTGKAPVVIQIKVEDATVESL